MEQDKSNKDTITIKGMDDMNDDKYRLLASVAFMVVVIVIGVPMWWKTTEVYRVSLPNEDILRLSEEPIRASVKVAIYTRDVSRGKLLIHELKAAYGMHDFWFLRFEQILPFDGAATAKTPASLEKQIMARTELGFGDFVFIEWPTLQEELLMTTERSALMRGDTSASKIRAALNGLVLQQHRMQSLLTQDQRRSTKSAAPQSEYEVVVSVLNPRPDIVNAKWNVALAVQTYIAPFLKEVSLISKYTLRTQWKFQVPIEAELKQVRDQTKLGRHYALPEAALPHIITAIEKDLGVGITDKSVLNLVVYLPPCDLAPVHIYDQQDRLATENNVVSFISPNWGGLIIANPPEETCLNYKESPGHIEYHVQTNDVMQIMLHQLHKLLDIQADVRVDGVKSVALEQLEPRRWEFEAYIRRSAVKHITTATNTLQSLIKLLDDINYIVINDEVGAAVNAAYKDIVRAKEALQDNRLLDASTLARAAFLASEQAFFDASLLAQLYFPDDQKYAIYIPLFLPIMTPVVTSFSMIRKLLGKMRSERAMKEKIN